MADHAGFKPVAVEYPLADLNGAVRYTKQQVERYSRHGRAVYAYGKSAGGTLAALLAERGLVLGAATYSQVSDLFDYAYRKPDPELYKTLIRATNQDFRRQSPIAHEVSVRVLPLTPVDERSDLNRSTHRWDAREKLVRTIDVPGEHVGGYVRSIYISNVKRAMNWLARHAGLRYLEPITGVMRESA